MRKPTDSFINTLLVPAQGNDPATLFKANDVPMRIVVRNSGGALMIIAHETTVLQNDNPLAGCFRLPAGASEVFVLMPKQGIYAACIGAGGFASIAVSEALSQGQMES
jgi:hypothetical protein